MASIDRAGTPAGAAGETNRIAVTKHHGLGNDFLIAVAPSRPLDGDDAVRWCHRRTGIGADGLIQVVPEGDGTGSEARWRMTLWNSDGSRAQISGNGLRCVGQALAAHLGIDRSVEAELAVETDAGTRTLQLAAGDPGADTVHVRASMGKAVDGPSPSERFAELGVDVQGQRGVDIGNPHLVAFVADTGPLDVATIGRAVEADYPGGLNVHLVSVDDPSRLTLKVWERGAGVTEACGSGACAAGWAANQAGLVGSTVDVVMPGGSATVELVDGEVFLTGPATVVGEVILHG